MNSSHDIGCSSHRGDRFALAYLGYTPARMARTAAAAGIVTVPIRSPHPRGARWLGLCPPAHAQAINDLMAGSPAPRLLAAPRPSDDATVLGSLASSARRLGGSLGRRLWRSGLP